MSILDNLFNGQKSVIPEAYKNKSVKELESRVLEVKEKLGKRLFIPGHHYQKDEIVKFADATGDSLRLAQLSAQNTEAEFIAFCGVHFMAETADIVTRDSQKVYLPDMRAGCSMADMANLSQTEECWQILQDMFGDTIIPMTYVNSTAEVKAFVGRKGGATVTSSNAKEMLEWAFSQKERVLFLPDQHLGRNTAAFKLGIPLEQMGVWNPHTNKLVGVENPEDLKVILWKGYCSVHEAFTPATVEHIRDTKPDMKVLVHPECPYETVVLSDYSGSTSYIIKTIEEAPAGSKWAIGTEMNLVQRLINQHKDKEIVFLNPHMCACVTMNRIDLPHLVWCLDMIENGDDSQLIKVPEEIAKDAKIAIDRMLERA